MTGERTYPVLPCADLDDALEFYAALGLAAAASPHAIDIRETTVEGQEVRFASELQNPRWHGAAAVAAP